MKAIAILITLKSLFDDTPYRQSGLEKITNDVCKISIDFTTISLAKVRSHFLNRSLAKESLSA